MAVGGVRGGARLGVLPARRRLSGQTAFVHFQVHGGNEPHVRRNTVPSCEGHNVAGYELICEDMQGFAVAARQVSGLLNQPRLRLNAPDGMTMVGHELVKGL